MVSLVLPPQATGHTGTAGHNRGHGAEEARLPCGTAGAGPGEAGGAGALGLGKRGPPVANLVSVRLRAEGRGGHWQDFGRPCPSAPTRMSPGAPTHEPEPFSSSISQFWPGSPSIPCETGSWVTCCLA